jgi:acyl transferase domain-containing protein/acyl carrier protein
VSALEGDKQGLSAARRALLAVEEMRRRVDAMERARREPIAIVGTSCRFPGGANDPDGFWALLRDGRDAISEVPASRWDIDAFYDPNPDAAGKMVTRFGGFCDRVDEFDAAFFEISPLEATFMDPQQRLLLETVWEALEDAGQSPDDLAGSRTGVFLGVMSFDYASLQATDPTVTPYSVSGTAHSIFAGRLSFVLDLTGPAFVIDCACSSSLVALHLACESLRRGESDAAIVGGVNVIADPMALVGQTKMRILAPDGRCKTFDARADGYVRGEGCGAVVVRRLSDALGRGDHIHAIVRGSAVNQDGRSAGLTAPNGLAQQRVIRQALENAGVPPEEIEYVEAHGTGTPLGDPIEMESLAAVFGPPRADGRPCLVGSVKTNVGHLEAAAGMAGLMKVTLALEHEAIPPHLHLEKMNPYIRLEGTPFEIPRMLHPWPRRATPRRAGLSAMGFSGTNAHIVLEEAPAAALFAPSREWQLLCLSAASEDALAAACERLAAHLDADPTTSLADVAYTLQVGRRRFAHRQTLVCRDREDAVALLRNAAPARVARGVAERASRGVAFMFPGVGDHYPGMARELYETEPVFRAELDRCAELLRPSIGVDVRTLLYPAGQAATKASGLDLRAMVRGARAADPDQDRLSETIAAQPAVFAIEWAMARLWIDWGIQPEALIGHSIGEYVAAAVAGVFELEDALQVVATRARLVQALPAGAMLGVALSEAELRARLDPELALSAINAPASCTVGGPVAAIERLHAELTADGVVARRLPTSHAFHTAMLQPAAGPFAAAVAAVPRRPPEIPLVSNVTGTWITAAEATDPAYWARHLCQPVRFADGVAALDGSPRRTLLEVGPGQALGSFVLQQPVLNGGGPRLALPSIRYAYDRQSDVAFALGTLGRLWLAGAVIDWARVHRGERRRRVSLPTYPFQRQRYWVDTRPGARRVPASAGKRTDAADWFYAPGWSAAPLVAGAVSADTAPRRLVFADAAGLGDALAARLGGATVVCAGDAFERVDSTRYTIDPRSETDYVALVRALVRDGGVPDTVIHLWNVDRAGTGGAGPADVGLALEHGFYSLVYWAKALAHEHCFMPMRIEVVTTGLQQVSGRDLVEPGKSTTLGACKVLPQEYPNLTCRSVDLDPDELRDGGWRRARLVDRLAAEVGVPRDELVVAYRGARRFRQTYERLRLEHPGPAGVPLREDGVYLVSGGFGSIGLAIAEHLARRYHARIALLGRSPLPPRIAWSQCLADPDTAPHVRTRIAAVERLEALGAEVLVLTADVADAGEMRRALAEIDAQLGALDGVFHAAGVFGLQATCAVQDLDRAVCETLFRPKVEGVVVLDELLCGRSLDFCLLLSSISSVLGGLGLAAYSAANLFMDAFAQGQPARTAVPWLSVNWDYWGLESNREVAGLVGASVTEFFMTADEGTDAVERVLAAAGAVQIVNSTGDLQARIEQWIHRRWLGADDDGDRPRYARPSVATPYEAPRDDVERRLVAVWGEVLGIDGIGVHDNFLELGGNSLAATQAVARIRSAFGVDVPMRSFFDEPTVAGLARAVAAAVAEPDAGIQPQNALSAAEAEALLARLDTASDDEVERALSILAEGEGDGA